MFFRSHLVFGKVSKLESSKLLGYLMVLSFVLSAIIPLVTIPPAAAADPGQFTLKWTGFVSGGGEALLTYDAIPGTPGEEVFHAGGAVQTTQSQTQGSVRCLNGRTGSQIWRTNIYGVGDTATMQMADVDNDGKMEILVALQHPGGLYILNAEDGSILWNAPGVFDGHPGYFTPIGGRIDGSGVVGDTDNDGRKDIFIGVMAYEMNPSTGKIIHYEWNGNTVVEIGRVQVWHPCAGGLSLGDTDNDGTPELYMNERDAYFGDGSWGRGTSAFNVWNGTHDVFDVRWRIYDWGASSDIPMLADVNKDGQIDVVSTNLGRGIMVLNSTDGKPLQNAAGTTLKATNLAMHAHYQASIYDIDGDGNSELLCADGKESQSFGTQVFDLWGWKLDADIPAGYSFRGPSIGEVTGDGLKDIIVVTFDLEGNTDTGTVQVYDHNYQKLYENGGLRHRAIGSVVQDVDHDDGGLNELLVLTQGGRIYCFETPGLSEEHQGRQRARSEVHFFSESRMGASEYIPLNRAYPDVTSNSPANGELGVSTGLSSLSFMLNHPFGELMDYVVTANFGVSSASGNNVGDGLKTVTVNGPLVSNTTYHWQLRVTDDSGDVIAKNYSFTTGPYVPNSPPTQTPPSLVGTTILDNLNATAQGTNDVDGNNVTNVFNWQKGGTSLANINLPFETQTNPQDAFSGIAKTKDYAYGATGDVFGATWTPDGKVGGAYSFDGNDFIRFPQPSASSTRYDGNGGWTEMSVESWVKASTIGTERLIVKTDLYDVILPGEDNTTSPEISYRLDCSNSGSALSFTWRVGVGPTNIYTEVQPIYTLGPYSVTSNTSDWHHVVVTYKSGAGLRLYVDGVLVNSLLGPTYTGNIFNTDGPFEIAFGSGSDFRGLVDEVRLYPFEVSPAMVSQRYLDTKDGLSTSSTISKYDTNIGDQWRCQVTPNDGLVDGTTSNTATNNIVDAPNSPPSASNLVITPASPFTGDNLVASYTYSDPEGNLEYGSIVSWYKNGVFVFSNPTLPASLTTKDEIWSFRVTPSDGFEYGSEASSGTVTIANSAPSITSGLILPDPALDSSTLTASTSGWTDPDGDTPGYTYQWQIKVGGVYTNITGMTSQTLSTDHFSPGDWIAVKVTAFDGSVSGNTLTFETNIIDSDAPTTGTPVVSGSRDDDELTCTPIGTSDPDGDNVTNIFNWLKGSGSGTSTTNLYLPFEIRSSTGATDYSGYGNNGTVTGATWTPAGRIGGAYSFDGNDVITVADSTSLGNDGTWNKLTVEYWVYPSVDQGRTVILNKNGDSASTMGKYMTGFMRAQGATPNNVIFFGVYTAISEYEEPSFSQTYDNVATRIPSGQWSHVVGTYEAGFGLKLYINGALASQLPGVTGNIEPSVDEPLIIGYSSPIAGTANRYFKGSLDEIRIYPTVLSAAQVFQDYIDQKDGVSDKVTIVPQETSAAEIWRCRVTPNDGWQDGASVMSNQLTIASGNTKPRIDWYSPAGNPLTIYENESISFMQTSSDPNASPLTYSWTLDSVQRATTQNWTYTAGSASSHVVRVTVSDGTASDYQEWTVNVIQDIQYQLHVETIGSGTTDVTGNNTFPAGQVVPVRATGNIGWALSYWLLNGSNVGAANPYQLMMDNNYNLTAVFVETQYQLHVEVSGSGTTNATGDALYGAGTNVKVAAPPSAGWSFGYWLLNNTNVGAANPYSLLMNGNYNLTAVFIEIPPPPQYQLHVEVKGQGTTNATGDHLYNEGTSAAVTATQNSDWVFTNWLLNGTDVGTANPYTLTMNANYNLTAVFTAPVTVFDDFETGTFEKWTGTTVTNNAALIVNTNQPHEGSYSAQFTFNAGTGTRRAYCYQTIDATPELTTSTYVYFADGLPLANGQGAWLIQYVDAGGSVLASFGIRADATATRWAVQSGNAPYALAPTSVAAPNEGNWYLIEAFYTHAATGKTLIITVNGVEAASLVVDTSAVNEIASLRVGGGYYTGSSAATIYMDDVTIGETAPPIVQYNLNVQVTGQGSTNATGNTLYNIGTSVAVLGTPSSGWQLSHWILNGTNVGSINPCQLTMNDNYDCTAVFTEIAAGADAYLIVRGQDNEIYYRTYDGATDSWLGWNALPGATIDTPAATLCDSKLYIALLGSDGYSLYFGSVNLADNVFSGWSQIEGAGLSTPTLTSNGTHVFMVVRGFDNMVYYRAFQCSSGVWGAWHSISGLTCDTIAATVADGCLYFAVRGYGSTEIDNQMLWSGYVNLADDSFSGWTNIAGLTNFAPTLASTASGTVFLTVKGMGGEIYLNELSGGVWQGWSALSGITIDSPALTATGETLQLVVVSADGVGMWHCSVDADTHTQSAWSPVDGKTPSAPILTS